MAKLTVSLLSLLVLFSLTVTRATNVCNQDCTKDNSLVCCTEVTQNGMKSYGVFNQCQIDKKNNCSGKGTSAKRVDASKCNNNPLYKFFCLLVLGGNIDVLSYSQGCIGQNGSYKQGEVLGVNLGLLGFCARQGQIANPEQCSAQG